MRRADAAGGEHMVVAPAERIDCGDDLVLDVGHDADLANVDADRRQVLGDVADVLVLGSPGEDFVADDQDGGGDHFPPRDCLRLLAHLPDTSLPPRSDSIFHRRIGPLISPPRPCDRNARN